MVTRNSTPAPDEPAPDRVLTPPEHFAPGEPAALEVPRSNAPPSGVGRFWAAADELPGLATTLRDWVRRLGDEFGLVRPFLEPTSATSATSDRHPGDLVYEVDRWALAGAVASALGMPRPGARGPGDPSAVPLGPFAAAGGTRYACFLAFTGTRDRTDALVRQIGAGAAGPVLVLLASRLVATAAAPDLRGGDLLLAPLAATVALAGPGLLRPVSPLEAALAWAAAPGPFGDAPRNALRRIGGAWSVTFAGRGAPLGDLLGVWYIASLFQLKGREIGAAVLRARVHGRVTPRPYLGDEVMDQRAAAEQEADSRTLVAAIQRAREEQNLGLVEALQGQLHTITEQVQKSQGLGGRARRAGDKLTSVRTSVKNAIDLVIEKLRGTLPDLARHLEASIHTGATLTYAPHPDVVWEV